jgi:hypothetical protein
MSSGVSVFAGALSGVGVGDALEPAVGVAFKTGNAFFIGWWECGSAKETPAKATKTARIAVDSTPAFIRAAKGQRRFLAIMVAIFGGFKAEFSGRVFLAFPGKQRTPASGGKLAGVQVCGSEDMLPDLASASAKWNPRKIDLRKRPRRVFCGCPLS